ncbi:MAG: alpha/beta hydrolase [Candidatus Asgardarchaeia archaeon]
MKKPLALSILVMLLVFSLSTLFAYNYLYGTKEVHQINLMTDDGIKIAGSVYIPTSVGNAPYPVAILLHGFGGNKEMFKGMAINLARYGIASIAIDFRGHGDSEGKLPANISNSVFVLIHEVAVVISYINNHSTLFRTDKVAVVGHSMGGGTAILSAIFFKQVKCVIGLAPVPLINYVNVTNPAYFFIATGVYDNVISLNSLKRLYFASLGFEGELNRNYNLESSVRGFYLDSSANHFSEPYDNDIISHVISWLYTYFFGQDITVNIANEYVLWSSFVGVFATLGILIGLYTLFTDKQTHKKYGNNHNFKYFIINIFREIVFITLFLPISIVIVILFMLTALPLMGFSSGLFLSQSLAYIGLIAYRKRKRILSFISEAMREIISRIVNIKELIFSIPAVILFTLSLMFFTEFSFDLTPSTVIRIIYFILTFALASVISLIDIVYYIHLIRIQNYPFGILTRSVYVFVSKHLVILPLFFASLIVGVFINFLLLGLYFITSYILEVTILIGFTSDYNSYSLYTFVNSISLALISVGLSPVI